MKNFFIVLFFVFAACSKQKPTADTVVVGYHQEFSSLDPQSVDTADQARTLGLCYEQLFQYDPESEVYSVRPEIASGMPEWSADKRTLTIKIRKGVTFSDHSSFQGGKGREVTSQDVAYSFLRIADPHLSSPNYWLLENKIEGLNEWRMKQKSSEHTDYGSLPSGILLQDEQTIVLKLKVEIPQILHTLTHHALSIVAREVVENLKGDFARHPVCTGPYRFLSWKQREGLELELNPTYWNRSSLKNPIPKISFRFFDDLTNAFIAFKEGKIDLVKVPPTEYRNVVDVETRGLKNHHIAKGWTLHELPALNTSFVLFNMDDPVIRKVGVVFRQAISLALDRKALNLSSSSETARFSHGPVPPQVLGYDPAFKNPFLEMNLERAKTLLKSSSWKEDQVVKLLVYEGAETVTRFLSEALQSLGIKFEVQKVSMSDFMVRLQNKDYQLSFMTWEADYPDAENFLQLLYGPNAAPSPNFANFRDASFDKSFSKMRVQFDGSQKKQLIGELQEKFVKQLPWAPLFHDSVFYLSSKRLKSIRFRHLIGENPLLEVDFSQAK